MSDFQLNSAALAGNPSAKILPHPAQIPLGREAIKRIERDYLTNTLALQPNVVAQRMQAMFGDDVPNTPEHQAKVAALRQHIADRDAALELKKAAQARQCRGAVRAPTL